MWRLPSLLALLAGLSCGTALAGEPILGTFAIDPVRLVRDGQQSVGRAELTLEHANFRYLFSSEESRDVFLADPVEYEIQLGGGCARMGALSGTGRTDSFTVHEGRLYIFASEECRSTFLRDPSKVLEPLDESDMEATSASRVRGRELIELAVDWLGGAERVDTTVLRIGRHRSVKSKGEDHQSAEALLIAPGGRLRKESSYDDQSWIQVLTPVDAFFVDPETGVRTMRLSQRRALQRAHQREVLGLLQGRDAAGFQAASAGRSDDGVGEVVHVHFNGMNQVLTLDPGTGRIQSQAFLGWGPQATIGQVERTYTQWESHAGVQMPTAWEARFDGTLLDPRDRRADGYSIDVLGETAADLFSRPKDRRFDVITRKEPMPGKISYLNPEGLHRNPAFTQLVVVSGRTRTAYIGGQNAVDRSGSIVGKGDIGAQAEQVAKNLLVALAAADAQVDQIVKWTVYVVQGQPVGPALGAFQRVFGTPPNPPTISVLFVAGLAHPDFLLEVEAVAVVPEE